MAKIGRNDLCTCGSGKKFKRCCEAKTPSTRSSRFLMVAVGAAVAAAVVAGVVSFTSESHAQATGVWDPVHGHYH